MAAHKDASVVEFENTLKRNPASLVFSRLADSYRKRGDIQQAIEVCSRGLTDHPDSVTGRIILGRCFLEQEKLTEAMQEFVSVIEHDHRNQVALKMLADIYARQGMKEKAGDLYAYLCGFDPENETLFNLVKTYAGTGKINIFEILGFSSPPPAGRGSASRPQAAADDIFDNRADGPGDSSPAMDDAAFAQTMKFDTEELAPGKGEALGADFARTIQYEAHDLQPSGSAAYEVEEVVDDSAPGAGVAVTGDDISNRMSMMFEDEVPPADSLSKTSEMEAVPAELQPPEITDAGSSDDSITSPEVFSEVSGADVSSRIDQLFSENRQPQSEHAAADFTRLFDEPENSPVEAPNRGLDTQDTRLRQASALGVSTDESKVSGEDIVSRMNEMFETVQDAQAPQAAEIEAMDQNREFEDEAEVTDVSMSLAASLPESVEQTEDVISGDDIALRLETIFDEEPVAMTQTSTPDARAEIIREVSADEPIEQAPMASDGLTEGNRPGTRGGLDAGDALDTLVDPEDETFMAIDAGMAAAATVIEEQPLRASDSSLSAASLASSVSDADGASAEGPGELTDGQLHAATLELEDTAQIDDTPEMSGNDVLGRLDEMFPQSLLGDDGVTLVDEIPDNDKDDEPVNQGFYTMSGDNAETAKSEESLLEKLDDVEFETPSESPVSSRNDIFAEAPDAPPGVEATDFSEQESLRAVESFEPPRHEAAVEPADQDDDALPPLTVSAGDQQQSPDYSIPDHVLTPTLADIYFQQGQPHLAVEIYQRLLRKDPDNERMVRRIADIERHIAATGQQQLTGNEKIDSKPAVAKAPLRIAKPPVVRKPLAGVRIKKSDKKKNKKR